MSILHGIDVSGHQPPTVTTTVKDYAFAIVKVTGGSSYVSKKAVQQIQGVVDQGKKLGLYHFALDRFADKGPEVEADLFLKTIEPYLKYKPVLVLDWEADAIKLPISWALVWLKRVEAATGVRPLFYSYSSFANDAKAAVVQKSGYPLWIAAYGDESKPRKGYVDAPQPPESAWGDKPSLFQFTRVGRLAGYEGDLDLNVFYGDSAAWAELARDRRAEVKPPVVTPPAATRKTGQQLAEEVLAGKWGNGADRVGRLRAQGYNAEAVQAEVNRVLTRREDKRLAREVINGKWGDGTARVARLKEAGWDPEVVQQEVNRQLGVKSGPTVSQLADEVIAGKWGNDPIRSARLRLAGHNVEAVQAEVNRKLK